MTRLFFFVFLFVYIGCVAQKRVYSTANAHSHNDYQQGVPFHKAWQRGFGSMEADIFLHNDKLIVAHDSAQLARQWTLDSLYIGPLLLYIEKNGGRVYADKKRSLQFMIDIKSAAHATLHKLIKTLQRYPSITKSSTLKIVISGNRPSANMFTAYPSWIQFDGELRKEYNAHELKKIEMLSDNFARYSTWKGVGPLPENDKKVLQEWTDKAHALGKKIRFWNAPDTEESWKLFVELGVDYINTDNIEGLNKFLNQR
jgi:alkaline phosphatase